MGEFDLAKVFQHLSLALPGFLLGIVVHEVAHAYVALNFGDDTAKQQGRLSFNPAVHYDLVGTVLFPLFGIFMGSLPFGWARPVPVDSRRFKNVRWGIFWVSFAGPGANILLALLSSFLFAIVYSFVPRDFFFFEPAIGMLNFSVQINLVLAVFNLIPFPPLDGAKMVSTFLNYDQARKYEQLQNYTFIFIVILWTTNIFGYILRPALATSSWLVNFLVQIMS